MHKILTLSQLVDFCEKNKFYSFSSAEAGYQLQVQVPGVFEVDKDSSQGLLFTKLKVCHTLLNRNRSYISEENMKKAMPSLKYRPVLGYIHQLDSGEYDFHRHDMEITKDENGKEKILYKEHQIGTFTADEPYLEYDKDMDKTYVIANAVIPEEYTLAADIIRRKDGTKVSCELCINSFSYNAKERYIELIDFYFLGCTALGCEKDGTEIGEGMLGSRLDIADFSMNEDSVYKYIEETSSSLKEILKKIDALSINTESKKGGESALKLNELLDKYNKTLEDLDFDYENMTDEELVNKFEELFSDLSDVVEEKNDVTTENSADNEDLDDSEDENDAEDVDNEDEDSDVENETEAFTKSFEISHDDIRYALYCLLATYEESDNEYYWISNVYDSYFVYENFAGNKIFGQAYSKDDDNISFEGERYTLHKELLNDSEYAELQHMRSNYTAIMEQLDKYQKAETKANKENLIASKDYALILDKEDFIKISNSVKEGSDNCSLDELKSKCDEILLSYAKSGDLTSTSVEDNNTSKINKKQFTNNFNNNNSLCSLLFINS